MSDQVDSSDEEDVFECGRCKEKFTDMKIFICHKKEKSCYKSKKQAPLYSQSDLYQEIQPESTSASKTTSKDEHSAELLELYEAFIPDVEAPTKKVKKGKVKIEKVDLEVLVDNDGMMPSTSGVDAGEQTPHGMRRRAKPDHFCYLCNKGFINKLLLEHHLVTRRHMKAEKEQNRETEEDTEYEKPVIKNTRGLRRTCNVCSFECFSIKGLRKHMAKVHADHKKRERARNQKVKHDSRSLCRECGSLVSTKILRVHEKRCANRKILVCPLCEHQSREQAEHDTHIDRHKIWMSVEKHIEDNGTEEQMRDSCVTAEKSTDDSKSLDQSKDNMAVSGEVDADVEITSTPVQYEGDINLKSDPVTLSEADLAVLGLMPSQKTEDSDCATKLAANLETNQSNMEKENTEESAPQGPEVGNEVSALVPEVGNEVSAQGPEVEKDNSHSSKTHHRQLKCKLCDKWFSRTELTIHMRDTHDMVKHFQCPDVGCLKVYTDVLHMKEHVASHSTKRMFCCGCRHCFSKRDEEDTDAEFPQTVRKWKMRRYYSNLTFKCKICWTKFPSELRLKKHEEKESHHYPCDKCEKVSVSRRQLKIHMITHMENRRFLCDMCGNNFKTVRGLKRHINTHSSVKQFVCSTCGKGFHDRNKLTRHCNTVHSVERKFACDHPGCRKTFGRRDKLREHVITHEAIPPFRCKYCEKGFHRIDSMKDHIIVIHTKEFPYRCQSCMKGFMRPNHLEKHRTSEHGQNKSAYLKLLKAQVDVKEKSKRKKSSDAFLKMVKAQSHSQDQSIDKKDSTIGTGVNPNQMNYIIYDDAVGTVFQGQNEAVTFQTLQPMTVNRQLTNTEMNTEVAKIVQSCIRDGWS